MTVEIKKCGQEDLERLQKISVETYVDTFEAYNTKENMRAYLEEAYNLEKLRKELLEPLSDFFFIFYDSQLAGYLKVNKGEAQTEVIADHTLEVERIYILPMFKRKGLGEHLIDKALEIAQKEDKQSVWLGVWEHNHSAQAFYKKMGFKHQGEHSFFMGDDEQTDFIMIRTL